MKKKSNQCQFCGSINCHHRIVRTEPPLYDEVYCDKHIKEAEEECDRVLGKGNGVMRSYISSTGRLKRGEEYK